MSNNNHMTWAAGWCVALFFASGTLACGSSEDPAVSDAGTDTGGDAQQEGGGALQGTMQCGDVPVATAACASCADEQCCDEGEACASNSACVALRACIALCPADDAGCASACGDENPAGKADNAVLSACRMRWCTEDCFGTTGMECGFLLGPEKCNECAQSMCCEVGWVSNTEPSFWQYQACVASCNDTACFQACDEQSREGRDYHIAFVGCIGTHCSEACSAPEAHCGGFYGSACAPCVELNCCDASLSCLTDPACQKLQACKRSCGVDAACTTACEQATPGAVDALEAMDSCLSTRCAGSC